MNKPTRFPGLAGVYGLALTLAWFPFAAPLALGQPVRVTAVVDVNPLNVGQTATLTVYAQVSSNLQAQADRIFSWYVDLLNTNSAAATLNYNALSKPASDNDPALSSTGTNQGANRRGIYDTFLNRPGAGVSNAVVLMTVPVTGTAEGFTRVRVQAGTSVPFLAADFLVAPLGGGDPWMGGDYQSAFVDLEVVQACDLNLTIQRINNGLPGQPLTLSFTPCLGYNHTVQAANALTASTVWNPLPGAPHNSGTVTVTNNVLPRFFRVLAVPQ